MKTKIESNETSEQAQSYALGKEQTVRTLALLRMSWRNFRPPEESLRMGFKRCAIHTLNHIEATTKPDDLWSSLPEEGELNEASTIGDHLSVTRQLLGLIA